MVHFLSNTKRFLLLAAYYCFLRYLPEGYHHPHFMAFNFARTFVCKKLFLACGNNVAVHRKASFGTGRKLSIGSNSHIGVNSWINAKGTVTIGKNVIMGPDVIILTGKHTFDDINIPIQKQLMDYAPVVIGDDVWIGARVIVLPGSTIGIGCVIGANSVVSKNLPPYSIAVGAPIQIINNRKDQCKMSNTLV